MQSVNVKLYNEVVNVIHARSGNVKTKNLMTKLSILAERNVQNNEEISEVFEEVLMKIMKKHSTENFLVALSVLVALEITQNKCVISTRIFDLLMDNTNTSRFSADIKSQVDVICCMKYPDMYMMATKEVNSATIAILKSHYLYSIGEYTKCKTLITTQYPENYEESQFNKQDSYYATSMNLLGCCYIKLKQYSRALLPFRIGLAHSEDLTNVIVFNLGLSFFNSGQIEPALKALQLSSSSVCMNSLLARVHTDNIVEQDDEQWQSLAVLFGLREVNIQNIQVTSLYTGACMAAKSNLYDKAFKQYQSLLDYLRNAHSLSLNSCLFLPTLPQILSEHSACFTKPVDWKDIFRNMNHTQQQLTHIKQCNKNNQLYITALKKFYFLIAISLNFLRQIPIEDVHKTEKALQKISEHIESIAISPDTTIDIEKSILKLKSLTLCNMCFVYILQKKSEGVILAKLCNALHTFSHDIDIRWTCVLVLIKLKKKYDACKLWLRTRSLSQNSKIQESRFKNKDTVILAMYNSILGANKF